MIRLERNDYLKNQRLNQKMKIESIRILRLMVEFGSPIKSTIFRDFLFFFSFLLLLILL